MCTKYFPSAVSIHWNDFVDSRLRGICWVRLGWVICCSYTVSQFPVWMMQFVVTCSCDLYINLCDVKALLERRIDFAHILSHIQEAYLNKTACDRVLTVCRLLNIHSYVVVTAYNRTYQEPYGRHNIDKSTQFSIPRRYSWHFF